MDGNIKDTPPTVVRARRRRPPTLGRAGKRARPPRSAVDAPQGGRAASSTHGCRGRAGRRSTSCPRRGLRSTPRSAKARATRWSPTGGQPRQVDLGARRLGAGPRRRQGAAVQARRPSSWPRPATSRRDQALLLRRLGQAARRPGTTGAIVARMDDSQRLPRLGPLAREGQASPRTSSTSGRTTRSRSSPDDAAQAGRLDHVFVTYDGSGKAAGREDLRQRQAPATRGRGRRAQGHDPHHGPAQGRPAAHRRRGSTSSLIQDLRALRPALSRRRGRRRSPAPTRACDLRRQAGRQAARGRGRRAVRLVARRRIDADLAGARRASSPTLEARGGRDQGAGHDRPRHAGEGRAADGLHPLPRRVRQAPRPGEGRHARRPAADARRPAAEPAGPGPVAAPARASADGPRDGQPVLAGGLRHRPRPHRRRLRRHRRAARRIPSCSTGWRSSSASRAGT